MGADPPLLSNAELLEWASSELRKYCAHEKSQKQVLPPALKDKQHATTEKYTESSNEDVPEDTRVRAIIAGQQAVSRDFPHLALTGDFIATPAPQGGWVIRYSALPAAGFASVPLEFVECLVAPDGTAVVRKSPDLTTRGPHQTVMPFRWRR